ncbi:hypothetical protein BH18ACI1_BH18ACI1_07020 [soil metagenome]|nr:hypothetical protein [Acidobacteriota bacterium]
MNETARTEKNDTSKNLALLKKLKEQVFESSNEKLALALGRPVSEIEAWFGGEEFDEDAEMKLINLAEQRLAE